MNKIRAGLRPWVGFGSTGESLADLFGVLSLSIILAGVAGFGDAIAESFEADLVTILVLVAALLRGTFEESGDEGACAIENDRLDVARGSGLLSMSTSWLGGGEVASFFLFLVFAIFGYAQC